MFIQHNNGVNFARRMSGKYAGKVSKTLSKLSSGYEINRAADNAAGLAVSSKMRSQIRGLTQSSRNCEDAVSLVQTMEAALKSAAAIIQRCRQIAAMCANGTYEDDVDREAMQLEYEQLCNEVDELSDTDFNGVVMLNGGRMADTFTVVGEDGVGWIFPETIEWVPESYVSTVNDPNCVMKIELLPGIDESGGFAAFEAAAKLDDIQIKADVTNGFPKFSFISDEPRLEIETIDNYGIISFKEPTNGIKEFAVVSIPPQPHNAGSAADGVWWAPSSSLRSQYPEVYGPTYFGNSFVTQKPSSCSDLSTEAGRNEYYKWVNTLPETKVTLNGDLDYYTYTINGRAVDGDNLHTMDFRVEVEGAYKSPNEKTYVGFSWDKERVKPGTTISIGPGGFESIPVDEFNGSSVRVETKTKNDYRYYERDKDGNFVYNDDGTHKIGSTNSYTSTSYPYVSLSSVTNTQARDYWLKNGNDKITVKYDITNNKWSVNSLTGLDLEGFKKAFPSTYNSFSALENKLKNLNGGGTYKGTSYEYDYDTKLVSTEVSFNFSITTPGPVPDSDGYVWLQDSHPNKYDYNNPRRYEESECLDFKLVDYDKNHPELGGIDYTIARDGATYTYVNEDNFASTAGEGYWVNEFGDKVDLQAEGVYLPSKPASDGSRFPDTDIFHNGMRISVGNPGTGGWGEIRGTVDLWDSQTDAFRVAYANLTLATGLVVQAGAHSKDSVEFTFEYESGNLGDLACDLNCSSRGLGMDKLSIRTQRSANEALDKLDHALSKVTMVRACFGAAQNRLEHKVNNLNNTNENITRAESGIRDADIAEKMREFTGERILMNMSDSMLAQANTIEEGILTLINSNK